MLDDMWGYWKLVLFLKMQQVFLCVVKFDVASIIYVNVALWMIHEFDGMHGYGNFLISALLTYTK